MEDTFDACDKGDDATVTTTTDGNVVLKASETVYFNREVDVDDYTRSGGRHLK